MNKFVRNLAHCFVVLSLLQGSSAFAQVSDGQSVNASVTNGAFLYKNSDTTALGKVNLNNASDPTNSGSEVFNIQRELNALSSFTGKPLNEPPNYTPDWINNDVGLSTDTLKDRADSLTAKFNNSTGHIHTGAVGDAPQIPLTTSVTGLLPWTNINQTDSVSGAASTPTLLFNGSAYTGGTSTTTKPMVLIQPSTVTTSNNWSTDGTYLGINADSGFTGRSLDVQDNGTEVFNVDYNGNIFSYGGFVAIGNTAQGRPGLIQLDDGLSSHTVSIRPGGSISSNFNFYLPTSAGSTGQPLLSGGGSGAQTYSTLGLTYGGTNANLSATGGAHQVLKQSSSGAAVTVGQLACSDLSGVAASCSTDTTNATNITSGTLAVGEGGTGQTTYTDGQLLIGNSSGGGLSKATLTAGSNITITNGHGTIQITASTSGTAPVFNPVSKSSTYSANCNDDISVSGSTFVTTLPDATTCSGQSVIVRDAGTNFTAYTIKTTSSQTITMGGTVYSNTVINTNGGFAEYTTGEVLTFTSDGTQWNATHYSNTGLVTVPFINFYTLTVSSANATIAATYTATYVFTITAGNTASVGAIFSNNGHNYTLAKALLVGDTSLVTTGPADPAASGTLTYVSGTHTGGNITFSAFSGTSTTNVYTVAQTIAAQTTLIVSGPANPPASGQLAKSGGTGDAIIVYSAFTGSANNFHATTTDPVFFGAPTTNTIVWYRQGRNAVLTYTLAQSTAGATAGSGDYLIPLPSGMQFDTSVVPAYTGSVGACLGPVYAAAASFIPVVGNTNSPGVTGNQQIQAYVYSTTQWRQSGVNNNASGSGNFGSAWTGVGTLVLSLTITAPISGWLP